ncbi:unnamed protein product [[Actinomadura] parvosata subsp. kistnae]|nr:unnamed protein product [Actinomadura parvosata subsp. kistnae]
MGIRDRRLCVPVVVGVDMVLPHCLVVVAPRRLVRAAF